MKRVFISLMIMLQILSAFSFPAVSAQDTPTNPVADGTSDFVLSYADIQGGPVDKNTFTLVDIVEDAEMGRVVRVSADPFTEKSSPPFVDCFGLKKYKIDLAKYKFVTIDYKLITDNELDCVPIFDIMSSGRCDCY